ncbi:putative transcription factor WD40-like family [Helianthus annuus]|nr:putative transcription factor WD40-like family [Helianthus annuus]
MAEDWDISDSSDDVYEEETDDEIEYIPVFVDDEDQNGDGSGSDTSAAQARTGKDIQGIPWTGMRLTREQYRHGRLAQYENYEDVPLSGETADKKYKQTSKGDNYYEFFYNSRSVKPTFDHFQVCTVTFCSFNHVISINCRKKCVQLRNMVWATSKHDVYVVSDDSIMHWSSLSQNITEILDFSGHVAPTEKHEGSWLEGFTQTRISTLAVKDNFLVAGGSDGELVCKKLDQQGVSFCTRIIYEDIALTTAIEIYDAMSGGKHFMTSNNDCGVRVYDMDGFQLVNHFRFPWPVNHTSLSPDRKLIAVVGDHLDGLLVDSSSGKARTCEYKYIRAATLEGHLDYSFASAWHPDGRIFATGNQDRTCRLWDIRNLATPVSVLKGNMAAMRSVRFSSDGQFLVAAEAVDFVHVYNAKLNYEKRQEIDFFGEVSGVSLSPDDETLYIGVWDPSYSSLLQFNRRHWYGYLDSFV